MKNDWHSVIHCEYMQLPFTAPRLVYLPKLAAAFLSHIYKGLSYHLLPNCFNLRHQELNLVSSAYKAGALLLNPQPPPPLCFMAQWGLEPGFLQPNWQCCLGTILAL